MTQIAQKQGELEDQEEMRQEKEEKKGKIESIEIKITYLKKDGFTERAIRTASDFKGAEENLGKLQRYIEKQI